MPLLIFIWPLLDASAENRELFVLFFSEKTPQFSSKISLPLKPAYAAMNVFLGFDASNEELGLKAQSIWAFTTNDSGKNQTSRTSRTSRTSLTLLEPLWPYNLQGLLKLTDFPVPSGLFRMSMTSECSWSSEPPRPSGPPWNLLTFSTFQTSWTICPVSSEPA